MKVVSIVVKGLSYAYCIRNYDCVDIKLQGQHLHQLFLCVTALTIRRFEIQI